ncbi:hypothetical protein T265_03870 [Opisthorchis viverrini]|uniref:Uncharacterized protein n=1 Tax=Opisthorchis viverrini TaxID=6198 RepID=A0A075A1Q4_OPIVI|nr:hypothetical protein T265_03870 [Opisthorchis viverrini]KER29490.1 hypothetical protein T265_03870 [Opisthorchis viverrini]
MSDSNDSLMNSQDILSLRLPAYGIHHPRLWFAQVEAIFECRRVRSQQTKYGCVVVHLPPEVAVEIADVIYEKPDVNPYDILKDGLIKRTAATDEQKLRVLLAGVELGDRNPAQLLRHMTRLQGKQAVNESILKELWLLNLLGDIRKVLSVVDKDTTLPKLAELADQSYIAVTAERTKPVIFLAEAISPTHADMGHDHLQDTEIFDVTKPIQVPTCVTSSKLYLFEQYGHVSKLKLIKPAPCQGPEQLQASLPPYAVKQQTCSSICKDLPVDLTSQERNLKLVGNLTITKEDLASKDLQNLSRELEPHVNGGSWMYRDPSVSQNRRCDVSDHSAVTIIIPLRNRWHQVPALLSTLIPLLRKQKICHRIFIVEQADDAPFNRAKLFNVGFVEAIKLFRLGCVQLTILILMGAIRKCQKMSSTLESG